MCWWPGYLKEDTSSSSENERRRPRVAEWPAMTPYVKRRGRSWRKTLTEEVVPEAEASSAARMTVEVTAVELE